VCNYDGLECSYNVSLYGNCSALAQGIRCDELFANGACDRACISAECLYDGRDCDDTGSTGVCNPIYDSYCSHHYDNGHCDRGCNTAECGWDGTDCDDDDDDDDDGGRAGPGRRRFADGTLIFIVLVPPDEFRQVHSLIISAK